MIDKKIKSIISGVLFILLGIVGITTIGYITYNNLHNAPVKKIKTNVNTLIKNRDTAETSATKRLIREPFSEPINEMASRTTSINSEWNLYTNPSLGFSIRIPKKGMNINGECSIGKDANSGYFESKEAMVPITTYEKKDSVYIAYANKAVLGNETEISGKYYYFGCEMQPNSLALLGKEAHSWQINVKEVYNDEELLTFIKEKYGNGCGLGNKEQIEDSTTYRVTIEGDEKDLATTECPLNYVYKLYFSPKLHKAATYSLGQASSFYKSLDDGSSYDKEMDESFQFIQ
jgi:hypothetical protein